MALFTSSPLHPFPTYTWQHHQLPPFQFLLYFHQPPPLLLLLTLLCFSIILCSKGLLTASSLQTQQNYSPHPENHTHFLTLSFLIDPSSLPRFLPWLTNILRTQLPTNTPIASLPSTVLISFNTPTTRYLWFFSVFMFLAWLSWKLFTLMLKMGFWLCYKVDWYPWGEEAFAEARKRDVPIFLSSKNCYIILALNK